MPEERTTTRTGLKILDEAGAERLGITLFGNGSVGLGLDAPSGTGDDRNRERINLVADAKGGASITFKDRRTYVASRMYLDSNNQVVLQFHDNSQKPSPMRQIGLAGDVQVPLRN